MGFVGYLPLFAALRVSRKHPSVGVMSTALYGLAGVFVSLVMLAVGMIVCAVVARGLIIPFGVAEIVVFIASTVIYVSYKVDLFKKAKRDDA